MLTCGKRGRLIALLAGLRSKNALTCEESFCTLCAGTKSPFGRNCKVLSIKFLRWHYFSFSHCSKVTKANCCESDEAEVGRVQEVPFLPSANNDEDIIAEGYYAMQK